MEAAIKENDISRVKELLETGYEVNFQNVAGDTPLHLAIANDTNKEILQLLLKNGANPKIRNKQNMSPLQCINQGAIKTIENILILEHSFDLRDSEGNTCLHIILRFRRRFVTDIGQFWTMISKLSKEFAIDFNRQNKFGDTLLLAASRVLMLPGVNEHIEFVLESLPYIDVFVTNTDGDSFLHNLCRSIDMESNSKLMKRLLKGEFTNCPKESIKKLLCCQNYVLDTPLLQFLQNNNNILTVETIKLFVDAGAFVNQSNIRGENALHRVVLRSEGEFSFEEEDYAENISYLVNEGADVNAEDITSSTPIMLVNRPDTVSALIDAGASVNKPNKLGQTPIISKLLGDEINLDVINILISKGADVNAVDYNKNSLLHYIAWERIGEKTSSSVLKAGAQITKDKWNQLPCHVAYYCRNPETFYQVCRCQGLNHFDIGKNFDLTSKTRDIQTLSSFNIEDLVKCFKPFQCRLKSDLLHLSDIGQVSLENEANEIKLFVSNLVGKLCVKFKEKDELFSCSVIESGSVGENTKVNRPNEFDFVCILQKFSEICEVDENLSLSDPGFAYLKIKDSHSYDHAMDEYFDNNGYFKTFVVWNKCQRLLQDILQTSDLFNHPNVVFSTDHRTPNNNILRPTCQFKFCWSGPFFKHLEVDVDIVLACQINGWWPQAVELESLPEHIQHEAQKEGCILILQTEHDEQKHQLRISALNAEKKFIKWLPSIARDSYIICKIMCDDRICPGVESGEDTYFCREYITSYELKTCMFHVFRESGMAAKQFQEDYSEVELRDFVVRVLLKLKHALLREKLESFLFPWQNIFTFLTSCNEDDSFLHVNCSLKMLFLVVILNFLNVPQDHNDIDVESIEEHWKEMKDAEDDAAIPLTDYWEISENILADN